MLFCKINKIRKEEEAYFRYSFL